MPPTAPGTIQRVDYNFGDPTDLLPSTGWDETFYVAGTIDSVFEQVTSDEDLDARLKLLHPLYALAKIRVSDVAVLRDSNVYTVPIDTGTGRYPAAPDHGPPQDTSEEPWDGVGIEMQDLNLKSRRFFALRGIPTDVVKRNFRYYGNPVWTPLLRTWGGRHVTTPGADGPAVPYRIQQRAFVTLPNPATITVGTDGRSLILTWTGTRPAAIDAQFNITNGPGCFLSLTDVFGADHINTIWRVSQLQGTTALQTIKHKRQIFTPGLSGAWIAKLVQYTYPPIAFATALRGCKRNTGGPTSRLHGRAPTR